MKKYLTELGQRAFNDGRCNGNSCSTYVITALFGLGIIRVLG